MNHPQELNAFTIDLSKLWQTQLKVLLEEKHLYQRVSIPHKSLMENHRGLIKTPESELAAYKKIFTQMAEAVLVERLVVGSAQYSAAFRASNAEEYIPTLIVSNVRMYCGNCRRREAFVPLWFTELSQARMAADEGGNKSHAAFGSTQIFALVFQCQACQGVPESFLIRRDGYSLWLEGRSPIEQPEVPDSIPQQESKHYRDAVLAMHTGRPLGAIFHLRTFIEQFARRVTGITGRESGDNILNQYAKNIPSDLRGSTPSLRDWYDRLSDAIHAAREDGQLFNDARQEIEQHFQIRKVFNIPEEMPEADKAQAE